MSSLKIDALEFWQYAVTVYAQDVVKNACLKLQDNFEGNVNVVLLCMLLDRSNKRLQAHHLDSLSDGISAGNQKLKRLRATRKAIKQRTDLLVDELHAKYQAALTDELEMEKFQQKTIVRVVNKLKDIKTCDNNSSLSTYFLWLEQRHFGHSDAALQNKEMEQLLEMLKEYI